MNGFKQYEMKNYFDVNVMIFGWNGNKYIIIFVLPTKLGGST